MGVITPTSSIYGYVPSKGIAITFVVLYGVSGALHLGEASYGRLWWLLPTVVLGVLGEIIGWACRYWSTFSGGLAVAPYTAQYICIILSPTFILAGYFILLGHIVVLLGPEYSRLKPNRYALLFCATDIVTLIIQGAGGSFVAGTTSITRINVGSHIALAGIALQLATIVFYVAFVVEFLFRFHYNKPVRPSPDIPTPRIQDGWPFASRCSTEFIQSQGLTNRKLFALHLRLQLLLIGMATSVLFILIRAIYRTIELAGGFHGAIGNNQVTFDVLDGAVILIACWVLNIFHPAFLLDRPKSAETKEGWVSDSNNSTTGNLNK